MPTYRNGLDDFGGEDAAHDRADWAKLARVPTHGLESLIRDEPNVGAHRAQSCASYLLKCCHVLLAFWFPTMLRLERAVHCTVTAVRGKRGSRPGAVCAVRASSPR